MTTPTSANDARLVAPVDTLDHVRGPAFAPVTLIEYADFECLHCGRVYGILQRLTTSVPDTFRLVYRHFPLGWEHPHANDAARAAEAAARQGRFWEMHDMLFRHQDALDREALRAYAEDLGLDLARFDADLADQATLARVERDVASGERSGVRGTPTFFLNGARYSDPWDLDVLRAAIARAALDAPGARGSSNHAR